MECRVGCGACCIAPSISSPIPGMPNGKPAGVRCINLSDDNHCLIFDSPERPDVCSQFQAELSICGNTREKALQILTQLENS
jgi:Fe-S-cluster containining protein